MANGKLELYGMTPIRALPITTHNELIALTTISSFQGQNETAFPGLDKLAERSGLSKQAFSKAVTGLVKKNLVNRKRRYGSSNIYFVVWEFADTEQIKKENDAERRMSRAKILAKNIQLSESLRYSNDSDVDYTNDSDVSYPNKSDDILKEQNKRTELKEQEISKPLNITQQLKDFATNNNLSYEINVREEQKAQSKLVSELSITNENLLAQLQRLRPILADPKCDWWTKTNSFGFNFMLKNWGRIDSWHNANKPKVREFKKPEIKLEPVKFSESHLDTLKEFLA